MSAASLPFCTTQLVAAPTGAQVTSHLQALITAYCVLSAPSAWPEDYGPTAAEQGLSAYDFVIIGAGTAGSVVASRLSENPNVNVLIIEAGDNPPAESEIPNLFLTTHRGPQVYEYQTEYNPNACLGTKTGTCYWPMAKIMGGRSSIDHLFSLRGSREKFDDEWDLPTWSYKEVTKYYDISERYSSTRGHLVLNKFNQYEDCNIREIISNGFEELGVKKLSNANSNNEIGYGYLKGPIYKGRRMGAGKTYLSVVKSRPNIHVIKNAEVSRINFIRDKVQSVTFVYKEYHTMNVQVGKEVILSAGVIGNPKLLMLSGIGPRQELERLNIPVVLDLPGVGQNLHDQFGAPVPFQMDKFKAKSKYGTEGLIDTFYYLTERYGPLTSIGSLALLGFISSTSNPRNVDLHMPQLYSQRNNSVITGYGTLVGYSDELLQSIDKLNKDGHLLFTFMGLQSPKSRGYVQLQSKDYRQKLKVYANYLDDKRDLESILQGFKFQMRLEETKAYTKARAEIVQLNTPCDVQFAFKSDDYWRCFIKYMVTTMYAPGGTTKMGLDTDAEAVVDLRLRVRGVKGLRAVGSSVYPSPIMAMNSQVMVAERLAAFIKEDYSL